MNVSRRRILVAAAAALLLGGLEAAPFRDGDTVVFYGDSLTHGGFYHAYVWEYYLTRYPTARITFYNAGIGGDDALKARKRFARDVAAHRPTVVSVLFGMNDVRRELYVDGQTDHVKACRRRAVEDFDRNLAAIDELLDAVSPREVYRLTPPPYEDTAVLETSAERLIGCNAALGKMAEVVRARAVQKGGTVVDLYTALNAYNREKQEKDPTFTIVGKDRVHPKEPGHLLMAYEFLKAQGVDKVVSDVGLDFARKEIEKSLRAKVSDVEWGEEAVGFTVLEESLPLPIDEKARPILADIPIVRDLNQQILQMRSLPRGRWALEIDGRRVGVWLSPEWERGINLAMNEKTPQYAQAQKVHAAVLERRTVENRLVGWKACKKWLDALRVDSDDWAAVDRFWNAKPNRKGYFESLYPDFRVNWDRRAEQEAKIEAATEVCRDIAKPVPHRYRIFLESRDAPEIPRSEMERKGPTPVAFPFESTVVVQGTQSTSAAAVEALNAIVRKATGRTFEVRMTGGLADCANKKKIYIGRGPELDEILVGWWIEKTYGEEESVVMLVNGDLFLFGKDALGSLGAVYDFCEDSLGYRGSRGDRRSVEGGTVTKTDVIRFNGVESRRQPAFRERRRQRSLGDREKVSPNNTEKRYSRDSF